MLPLQIILLIFIAVSVGIFTWVGVSLFSTGWQSYEEKYVEGAEKSLDSMFLTIPPQQILYLSVLSGILTFFFLLVLSGSLILSLPLCVAALFLPRLILYVLKKRRDTRFNLQIVDMLVNISNSLKAGFSLIQSFDMVHREMDNPMSQEIGLMLQETRLGVSLDEALQHLIQRMPSQDLDLIISSISISQEVGGNLSEVFDNIARTIRERRRIEGKIDSLTAQGKLQGVVICALPFLVALALSFLNPEMIQPLYTTPIGYIIILVVLIMEVIGGLVIKKIVSIDV